MVSLLVAGEIRQAAPARFVDLIEDHFFHRNVDRPPLSGALFDRAANSRIPPTRSQMAPQHRLIDRDRSQMRRCGQHRNGLGFNTCSSGSDCRCNRGARFVEAARIGLAPRFQPTFSWEGCERLGDRGEVPDGKGQTNKQRSGSGGALIRSSVSPKNRDLGSTQILLSRSSVV